MADTFDPYIITERDAERSTTGLKADDVFVMIGGCLFMRVERGAVCFATNNYADGSGDYSMIYATPTQARVAAAQLLAAANAAEGSGTFMAQVDCPHCKDPLNVHEHTDDGIECSERGEPFTADDILAIIEGRYTP